VIAGMDAFIASGQARRITSRYICVKGGTV